MIKPAYSVRLDPNIRNEASKVLKNMGLELADAFRMLATRIAKDGELPNGLLRPSPTTLAAMRELDEGRGKRFDTVKGLMDDLNADD